MCVYVDCQPGKGNVRFGLGFALVEPDFFFEHSKAIVPIILDHFFLKKVSGFTCQLTDLRGCKCTLSILILGVGAKNVPQKINSTN